MNAVVGRGGDMIEMELCNVLLCDPKTARGLGKDNYYTRPYRLDMNTVDPRS